MNLTSSRQLFLNTIILMVSIHLCVSLYIYTGLRFSNADLRTPGPRPGHLVKMQILTELVWD